MPRARRAGKNSYAGRFSVALGLALVVLVVIQVVDHTQTRDARQADRSGSALVANAEQIRYYDELLTMSARLAAVTGERSYVARYYAAVPELDRVIADSLRLADDPDVTAALADTSSVNLALIALEERSFAQLATGDREGAYATLDSREYRRLKRDYAQGLDLVLTRMEQTATQRQETAQKAQNVEGVLSAALVALVLALWVVTALGLRRTARGRDQAEAKLRALALHDPLTGLPNRVLLSQRIELAGRRRQLGLAALYYVDLDDFKQVNDQRGHPAGDLVLLEVARRLEANARPEDIVARLGGDEFAVFVEGLESEEQVHTTGRRLSAALAPPIDVEGGLVWCGASIGSAALDPSVADAISSPEDLLFRADLAMYLAKSSGKGRVVAFEERMYDDIVQEGRLTTDLREAFEEQQFEVWYEPVVDLKRGSMVGVEALVRWNHPQRGVVAAPEFVPRLTSLGLLPELRRLVLSRACHWAQRHAENFPDRPPLRVAVPLSPFELLTSEVVARISECLADAGLDPSLLTVHVTAGQGFEDFDRIRPNLSAVQWSGVTVAIADFGTRPWTLGSLRGLPVDMVKVDKSLVDGLATNLEDSTAMRAIIGLAHTMQLSVVAEGVETVQQLTALRLLGCEFGQGPLLGEPTPGDAVPSPGDIEERLHDLGVTEPPPPGVPEKFTILVADDVAEERYLLRRMLERAGRFEIVGEAVDGLQAIAAATSLLPAVVLLDLEMPGVDGLRALPLIVAAVPVTTRVVILSGRCDESQREEACRAGATACLDKGAPDVPAALLRILGVAA